MHGLLAWLRRNWLLLLVLVAFAALVAGNRRELTLFVATLRRGQGQWIAAAAGLQAVYFLLYSLLYQAAFLAVGIHSRALEILPVLLASIFVNTVVPSGGLGGAALFVEDAGRHGQPGARAVEGVLLVTVAEGLAVLLILLVGLSDLLAHHVLLAYQLLGTAIYLLYVAALTTILFLGRLRPAYLRSLLSWIEENANWLAGRFGRGPVLAPGWAQGNAQSFGRAAGAILQNRRLLVRTLLAALALEAANLASLYAAFRAFAQPIRLGALMAGYALGYVFSVVSFLPLDNGVMQGVMVLVYGSLGVATSVGLAVVFTWGGLNSWLPLLLGIFFLRQFAAVSSRHS